MLIPLEDVCLPMLMMNGWKLRVPKFMPKWQNPSGHENA